MSLLQTELWHEKRSNSSKNVFVAQKSNILFLKETVKYFNE